MIFKFLCVVLFLSVFLLYRTVMDTGAHISFDLFASACAAYAIISVFKIFDCSVNKKLGGLSAKEGNNE